MATAVRKLLINWEEEDSGSLPEGRYLFRVASVDVGESSSGNPQLIVKFVVLKPSKFKGRKQTVWYTLVPTRLKYLRAFLQAAGVEVPKRSAHLDLDKLEGKAVVASVQHRKSDDGTRTFVELVDYGSVKSGDDEDEVQRPQPAQEVEDEDDDLELE